MYHVIGTVLSVSLLYFTSLFFYRAGLYSKAVHKGLWNLVMAVTFLFTAIAGILLALQVNYKLDLPLIKVILSWHVEAGIIFAATGMFHFIWNISYFGKLFSAAEGSRPGSAEKKIGLELISSNLLVAGFFGTAVQILFIREMMNISGGYELSMGIFLGSWLIASAAGASLAGRSGLNDLRKINYLFSLSPLISLGFLIIFSRFFLETGESPSLLANLVFTFLTLVPVCLVSGFIFIKLVTLSRKAEGPVAGKSFSVETIGGIAAGILMAILTSGIGYTIQLLLLLVVLYLSYNLLTHYCFTDKTRNLIRAVTLILSATIVIFKPDIIYRQALLPVIDVSETIDTPYGNITKGEYGGETSIFYNHRIISYSEDAIEREENIHYAMLQAEDPKRVLLISGSLNSHLKEIRKYPVKELVFLERDPALAFAADKLTGQDSIKLSIESVDAYSFIRKEKKKFDVVIMLLPPPSTLSLNRYYTSEFFAEIKKNLTEEGIFMCSPGQADNYINEESVRLLSSIFNSLSSVFKNVKPLAGNKLYFIAGDKKISVDVCSKIEERNISTEYVNRHYLSDDIIALKTNEILSVINSETPANRILSPVASFHYQAFNISRSIDTKIPAIVLIVLIFAGPSIAVRRRNMLMYFTASSLAGFEIIILMTVQLAAGNLYQVTALVIAVMMAGMATGSGINSKFLTRVPVKVKVLSLVLYYLVFAFALEPILGITSRLVSSLIILALIYYPGFITGQLFRDLTMTDSDGAVSSSIYSADLAGSAIGFILMAGLAVPVFGIKTSVFILSILIFTGLLFGTTRNKY